MYHEEFGRNKQGMEEYPCFVVMKIEENFKKGVSLNITLRCDASIFQLLHSNTKNKDSVRIFLTAFTY